RHGRGAGPGLRVARRLPEEPVHARRGRRPPRPDHLRRRRPRPRPPPGPRRQGLLPGAALVADRGRQRRRRARPPVLKTHGPAPMTKPTSAPPEMSALEARQRDHVLYTWSAQRHARGLEISGGRGARFVLADGREVLDFESQTYNVNVGHGETRVTDAIAAQARQLAAAAPRAVFEAKARLGEELARVTPGDLDRVFFTLGGSEAVE